MPDDEIISVETFCTYYQVEPGFLETLETYGLISISHRDNQRFIGREEVAELERYSRMYYDLSINVAGIDALKNLLDKVRQLQQETADLRARLSIYE